MKRIIELDTWKRKEHFQFFDQFEEPFYGIVSELNCTKAYTQSKELDISFFLYSLHKILSSVNAIGEFSYRIENGKLVSFDRIHVSPTIGRPDETFAFSFFDFYTNIYEFVAAAKKEIEGVQLTEGLQLNENAKRLDTIHYSSIPWIRFTGLSHARSFTYRDSVPKISVGKLSQEKKSLMMPISIHVHHGLVDGLHVSKLLELIQHNLDQ